MAEESAKPSTRTVRVRIMGRVQGVCYRAWTESMAHALGLSGWVRNTSDGAVEALFSGPPDRVDRMLALCGDGPPAAAVSGIALLEEGGAAPESFSVLPTEWKRPGA
jgi:acylphosphatase